MYSSEYLDTHDYSTLDQRSSSTGVSNTNSNQERLRVDIGLFKNLCEKFRNKSHLRVINLRGQDRTDFNLMVSYVHLLYGTDEYKYLYELVKEYFNDLKEIKQGTVGKYFGGCLKDSGCSLECAGSIPRPKDEEGWSFCDRGVIFAEFNKGKYDFTVLKENDSENPEDCYVFVEDISLDNFSGFDNEEKEELSRLGARNINLIGCDESSSKYVDLYGDSKNIDHIKSRDVSSGINYESKDTGPTVKYDETIGTILYIFFFFLIIGLLLGFYFLYR